MPSSMRSPCLASLGQVADSGSTEMGCDAVAVTSDDATRHGYLREIAWSLRGRRSRTARGPRPWSRSRDRVCIIRPLMGFPLLHVDEPHFSGLAAAHQAR